MQIKSIVFQVILIYLAIVSLCRTYHIKQRTWSNCKCGLTKYSQKIIGGENVKKNSYPWSAALFGYLNKTDYFCGATLISSRFLLTAGHCFPQKLKFENLRIRLGGHNISKNDGITLKPKSYKIYENFNYNNYQKAPQYDIALVELEKDVELTDNIQPICIHSKLFNNYIGFVKKDYKLIRKSRNLNNKIKQPKQKSFLQQFLNTIETFQNKLDTFFTFTKIGFLANYLSNTNNSNKVLRKTNSSQTQSSAHNQKITSKIKQKPNQSKIDLENSKENQITSEEMQTKQEKKNKKKQAKQENEVDQENKKEQKQEEEEEEEEDEEEEEEEEEEDEEEEEEEEEEEDESFIDYKNEYIVLINKDKRLINLVNNTVNDYFNKLSKINGTEFHPWLEFEENLKTIGWGYINEHQQLLPDILQEIDIKERSNDVCRNSYGKIFSKTRSICANNIDKDSCIGDSGSALMRHKNGRYELYGLVSFGIFCAVYSIPGIYTRISTFLPWILLNSFDSKFCTQ